MIFDCFGNATGWDRTIMHSVGIGKFATESEKLVPVLVSSLESLLANVQHLKLGAWAASFTYHLHEVHIGYVQVAIINAGIKTDVQA